MIDPGGSTADALLEEGLGGCVYFRALAMVWPDEIQRHWMFNARVGNDAKRNQGVLVAFVVANHMAWRSHLPNLGKALILKLFSSEDDLFPCHLISI